MFATNQKPPSPFRFELFEEGPFDGPSNMSRDEQFLQQCQRESALLVRLYRWDGPWVSLGRFQSAERDLKHPLKTKWVMRPTGGKAVLHGHDLTVGLAVSLSLLGEKELERQIKTVYRLVTRPLIKALNHAGLHCSLAEDVPNRPEGVRVADCFAFTSGCDVIDPGTGYKVAGCALRIESGAALLQASIPVSTPLIDPAMVLRGPTQKFVSYNWEPSKVASALHKEWSHFFQKNQN